MSQCLPSMCQFKSVRLVEAKPAYEGDHDETRTHWHPAVRLGKMRWTGSRTRPVYQQNSSRTRR